MTSSNDPSHLSNTNDTHSGRRDHARGKGSDRRREAWRTFRHAYPAFLKVITVLFLLMVAFDIWLVARHFAYQSEIDRLRANMTASERQRSDLVIQSEQDKLRVALELAKRQAQIDPKLHLSVAVDSGRMYLLRDGALLRDMVVTVALEKAPSVKGDTATSVVPRGQRTIIAIDSAGPALVLNGGTRIYASADTGAATVTSGDIRANATDLQAVLPNVQPGMSVYFY